MTHAPLDPRRPSHSIGLAAVLAVFVACAVASALANNPWCDEAWFGGAAWNFATTGRTGTPHLDTAGTFMLRLNERTYWSMPLYWVTLAGWLKLFGYGVVTIRLMSVAWGVVALVSIHEIVRRLVGDRRAALAATAFAAADYVLLRGASDGRMDAMGAALGFAGIAAYLALRESGVRRAMVVGHTLVAASVLTHPNGMFPFVALCGLTIYFDRPKVSWASFADWALAACPYLIGLGLFRWYGTLDDEAFRSQFSGNASGRFAGLTHPIEAIRRELAYRWVQTFAAGGSLTGVGRLKAALPFLYLAGPIGCLASPELRRHRGVRAILLAIGLTLALLTLAEGSKSPLYLVYLTPWFAALLGIWAWHSWPRGGILRVATAAVALAYVALNLGGIALVARRDSWGRSYRPTIAFLREHSAPGEAIIAPSELSFELSDRAIYDDVRIGYFTGRAPRFIVTDGRYEDWFRQFADKDPAIAAFVRERLERDYRQVFAVSSTPGYRVYERR